LTRQVSLVQTQYRAPPLFPPQRDSGNFVGADKRCCQQERKTAFVWRRKIGFGRYLQALLTKSEIELKLSQCKIQ
jgi:hypothetical protein